MATLRVYLTCPHCAACGDRAYLRWERCGDQEAIEHGTAVRARCAICGWVEGYSRDAYVDLLISAWERGCR